MDKNEDIESTSLLCTDLTYSIIFNKIKNREREISRDTEFMFLVYNTDVWSIDGSKKLIGISKSKDKAINLCEQYAERENETLSFNSILSLKTMLQTQEYDGTGEFLIKKIEINTLQTHCLELPFYRLCMR